MPTGEELREVKRKFYEIAGFPNVIGCVDGTHIRIQSPGGENSELFRNRKGYFSINVQCICDADLRIRDVDARWQGSVHDSTVFGNSLIKIKLEERMNTGYLLGDSAYPSKSYLLTPVLNPRTPDEQRYNRSHIRTRNTIERCFGVLKWRFPCLSHGLRLRLETTVAVIVAVVVLHNIAASDGNRIEDNAVDLENEEQPDHDFARKEDLQGVAARTGVINSHFR
ncbi:hypothetical protein J437_LFUL017693 [Ladona fulva]|uniref:DDE Tnp4 domain-containing protein n=1 Tax=Ladona fulva TaxID=123851 RepID=A0A8K0KNH9_LADFU|nr:hypothetical protein J437_LFUL017693 [Ladona fulva]